jgi:hypothetical protein
MEFTYSQFHLCSNVFPCLGYDNESYCRSKDIAQSLHRTLPDMCGRCRHRFAAQAYSLDALR